MAVGEVIVHTDGASRGNPGPAGIGAVLTDKKGASLAEVSKFLGVCTNNIAEYTAVLYGLQEALILRAETVILHLDSELVAKQLTGEFRVKDPDIRRLFDMALNLFRGFKKVTVLYVPREKNKAADALANKAINLSALV